MSKFKNGNVVVWSPIPGKVGSEYFIVEDWSKGNPSQLLVAEVGSTEMKCHVASACDCVFVREGELPKRVILPVVKNEDETRLPANCVLAQDR
jgi:hypothetical protein